MWNPTKLSWQTLKDIQKQDRCPLQRGKNANAKLRLCKDVQSTYYWNTNTCQMHTKCSMSTRMPVWRVLFSDLPQMILFPNEQMKYKRCGTVISQLTSRNVKMRQTWTVHIIKPHGSVRPTFVPPV